MQPGKSNDSIVVSASSARTGFGKLLRRVDDEHRSLVIEKRGTPRAVLQTWRTFLNKHVQTLVTVDFFTVPTIRFQVLYVSLVWLMNGVGWCTSA